MRENPERSARTLYDSLLEVLDTGAVFLVRHGARVVEHEDDIEERDFGLG